MFVSNIISSQAVKGFNMAKMEAICGHMAVGMVVMMARIKLIEPQVNDTERS